MAEKVTGKFLGTICGKHKNPQTGLLPAYLRYQSPRIERVRKIAESHGFGFVILSGRFGLLQAADEVPYYDVLLTNDDIGIMTEKVSEQLQELDVTTLDFYSRPQKPDWIPYLTVIEGAAATAGVDLRVVEF